MSIPVLSSLRARLILLVLVGALPLLVLLVYSGVELRDHAIDAFQRDTTNLVMTTLNEQQVLVTKAHQLLIVLSEAPQIRRGGTVCNTYLAKLLAETGNYANLGVIDIHGNVICSGTYMPKPVNVADRVYFKRTLQSRDFSIGDYQVGRITHKPVLVFSYPVLNDERRVEAVLFAAQPLNWIGQYVAELPPPAGSVINIIDYSTYTLLAQYPESTMPAGSSVSGSKLVVAVQAAIETKASKVEVVDADGINRLHFFRLLKDLPGGKDIYIDLGVPTALVYAKANEVMSRNLVILASTLCLMLLLAWYGSYAMILRQVKGLLAATRRIAMGDLSGRFDELDGVKEISELGRELNQMAVTLEHRDNDIKQVESQLRTSEQHLRRVFDTVPDIIYTATASNNFGLTFVSSALKRILGFTPEEFIADPQRWTESIHPDDRECVRRHLSSALAGGENRVHSEYRMRLRDEKKYRWFEDRAYITRDAYGQATVIYGVMTDTTERRQAEMLSARMGRILETSWSELYVFDADTLQFIDVSAGACQNLGYTLSELKLLTPLDIKSDLSAEQFEELLAPLRRGEQQLVHFEIEHHRKDGSRYPAEVRLQLSDTEAPPVFIAHLQDVSERKRYIAELQREAMYDSLTNLPGRLLFLEHLSSALLAAQHESLPLVVLSVGVVRLSEVNDILGHSAGDIVLHEVAARLQATSRESDIVARLGGGEYAIVLRNMNLAAATAAAGNIQQQFELPMTIGDISLEVEAAIGIALYPKHGDDANALLQFADIAMHEAKNETRGFSIYKPENVPFSLRKLKLSGELRRAIEQKELVLFYQPKIDLRTGRVVSVEALARWPHPAEGMVSPADFIPMIEQSGLIRPFTAWVLEEAITQLKQWSKMGIDLTIAVNLSTRNLLDSELLGNVMRLLRKHEVDPERLTLEVTESALMSRPEAALKVLTQLHDKGLKLSIDDFGTGYSSLAYLKKLPVAELKIDQTFIFGITTDEDNLVIVRSTIELAQNMGLKVVAEGVEDQATMDLITSLHCDIAQGFHMGRPVPVDQLEQWLIESPWGLR
jgi:diguanylate cyclase (GGDEF)-like protein/PAS domain S-box-containing protein